MCRLRSIALAVLLSCLPLLSLAADDEKVVSIATLPGYSPYCFYKPDADNQTWDRVPPGSDSRVFQGYSWDVIRESFHAAGYTLQLRIVPWSRAMYEIKRGKVELLFPAGKNAARMEYMDYSTEPVNAVDFLIYTDGDSDFEWDGLESLAGQTIGAARGWNFGDRWEQQSGFEKQLVDSIEQGFRMLDEGRIDGFAGYEVVWDYKIREMDRSGEFAKTPAFDETREFVTALKSNPRGKQLLAAFDRGKRIITENGTMEEIAARWR